MADFLEERLPVNVQMGASYSDAYNVEITTTSSGSEYRRLIHPFPVRTFSIEYAEKKTDLWAKVISMYHRAYGMYAGFRVRCLDDFSTNGQTGTPTPFDAPMALVSTGVYQLQRFYGTNGTPLSSVGFPKRTIFKPVSGTVRVGVSGIEISDSGWSVNNATGEVFFAANKTANITAITKGSTTLIACAGHALSTGESVHISAVNGMTQINGKRAVILSVVAGVSITVGLDSSAYSAYGSGGGLNTRPQAGESVMAGCQFDIPCRFNSHIDIRHVSTDFRESGAIDIIELVNP